METRSTFRFADQPGTTLFMDTSAFIGAYVVKELKTVSYNVACFHVAAFY